MSLLTGSVTGTDMIGFMQRGNPVEEWIGVAIALLSSCLGGTAAAVTRYLVAGADPISLAILRWVSALPACFRLRCS